MYFYHLIVHYLLAYFAPDSLAYFHRNNHFTAGYFQSCQNPFG